MFTEEVDSMGHKCSAVFTIPEGVVELCLAMRAEKPAKVARFIEELSCAHTDSYNNNKFIYRTRHDWNAIYGKHAMADILKTLIAKEIIQVDNKWKLGEKSKGYRLSNKFLKSRFTTISLPCPRFIKSLANLRQKEKDTTYSRSLWRLEETLNKTSLDRKGALHVLEQMKRSNERGLPWVMIQVRKWLTMDTGTIRVGRTGRLYCLASNTYRQLRKYLKINGNSVCEVDLCNSQPFFIASLFPNISNLSRVTSEGRFYEEILSYLPPDITREDVKRAVLPLIYRRERRGLRYWLEPKFKHAQVARAMEEAFPGFAMSIDGYAVEHGDTALAYAIQRKESETFIEGVLTETQAKGIDAIPIHDSIMCEEGNAQKVKQIIAEHIRKTTNREATIKIETGNRTGNRDTQLGRDYMWDVFSNSRLSYGAIQHLPN